MKKRVLTVVVALILALSLLTGCGEIFKMVDTATKIGQAVDEMQKWPKNWPNDVPKMEGEIIISVGDVVTDGKGYAVTLTVKDRSVVTKYVDNLISKGYEYQSDTVDTETIYNVALTNDTYEVGISYSGDDNSHICILALAKASQ